MPVLWVTLRVIAVISLAIALVSQAVSFRTQPAELELSMTRSCQQHELTQHELPTAEPARGPRRILLTTSLLHVTTPAALHATSQTGACAQSQSCPGRATVMPVAAGPQSRHAEAWPSRKGTI